MQWTDEGIVIGIKRHGEASGILELMTREHGRHLGMVRGGFGTRLKPILQPGNSVTATWRARLDEHLGTFTVEPLALRASNFFAAPHAVSDSPRARAATVGAATLRKEVRFTSKLLCSVQDTWSLRDRS